MVILYLGKNDAVVQGVHSPTHLEIDTWKLMSYSKLDYVCRMNEGKSWYFRTLVSDFIRERAGRWKERMARVRAPEAEAGRALEGSGEGVPDFLVQNGRDFFLKHVAAISDGCRRRNATLVLVTFSHALTGWDADAVGYYNQLLREFAEREGWPLVDFERIIAAEENPKAFFWDDHHPNEKGSRLLADELFQTLRDKVQAGLEAKVEEKPL